MILVLEGWIDAGFAAAAAGRTLVDSLDSRPLATFDVDVLVDHRSRRPVLHLVEGIITEMTFPSLELRAAHDPSGKDVLLLVGAEPDVRWRAFTDSVADLAKRFGVRLAIGLGAYPAPIPHTRPSRLAATATSEELVTSRPFVRATLDVPAGAQAAVERRCGEAGIPAIGLWAQVPHYASAMPYPAAGALLIDGLADLAGLELDARRLHEGATATRARLDELIANSDEHQQLVRQLEEAWDREEQLPSGEDLAAELQRFLREREE
jgi:predicted ATP-grasp superfamily ATP-dependent carboligase